QTHSATDLLQIIKQQLCEQTNRPKYELLIKPLSAVSYDNNVLVLSTANEMNRTWVLEQFGEIITELTELITGNRAEVQIVSGGIAPEQPDYDAGPRESVSGSHLNILPPPAESRPAGPSHSS